MNVERLIVQINLHPLWRRTVDREEIHQDRCVFHSGLVYKNVGIIDFQMSEQNKG